jgi:hypothetical protein
MWRLVTATILSLVCFETLADVARIPVEVVATAEDSVGKRLVYFVKEGIRSSSSLDLTVDGILRIKLLIVTLDQNSSRPGYSTAYSVVVTWVNPQQPFPFYLTQYVGYCGSNRVQECAQGLVASTAEQAEFVVRMLKAAYSGK